MEKNQKLFETMSKGIGFLYNQKPTLKIIDAKTYKLEKIDKPKAKRISITSDSKIKIIDNIREDFTNEALLKKKNIENILEIASKKIGTINNSIPVNENWIILYCKLIKSISNVDMQDIWGEILAMEVTKPNTINATTLQILNGLSQTELELFKTACSIALNDGRILKINDNNKSFDKYGITQSNLKTLCALELIHTNAIMYTIFYNENIGGAIINYGSKHIVFDKEESNRYEFKQVLFTPTGKELMQILNVEKNSDYLKEFIEVKKKEQFRFSL